MSRADRTRRYDGVCKARKDAGRGTTPRTYVLQGFLLHPHLGYHPHILSLLYLLFISSILFLLQHDLSTSGRDVNRRKIGGIRRCAAVHEVFARRCLG